MIPLCYHIGVLKSSVMLKIALYAMISQSQGKEGSMASSGFRYAKHRFNFTQLNRQKPIPSALYSFASSSLNVVICTVKRKSRISILHLLRAIQLRRSLSPIQNQFSTIVRFNLKITGRVGAFWQPTDSASMRRPAIRIGYFCSKAGSSDKKCLFCVNVFSEFVRIFQMIGLADLRYSVSLAASPS